MTMQLTLINTPKAWRLDKHTREVGREGVAKARAALREGRQRSPVTSTAHPPGRKGTGTSGQRRPAA